MRSIQVSIDVFHAIWKNRKKDEQSEDQILRRVFDIKEPPASKEEPRDITTSVGYHDPRFGVQLPVNFQIQRTYKGVKHTAVAVQGFWHHNGIGYPSLNLLNKAIGGGAENAWKAWNYYDEKKKQWRPMSELRDQSTIIRRKETA
jgi:hypothetical protein